jgi:hypothetical protein
MSEATESLSNLALAMFVSHNKPSFNGNHGLIEVEAGTLTLEAEMEVEETIIKALVLQIPLLLSTSNLSTSSLIAAVPATAD